MPFAPRPLLMRPLVVAASALAMAGCVTVPDSGERARPRVVSAATAAALTSERSGSWPARDWARGFADPQLEQLIAEAVRDAPDVRSAAARVAAATAQAVQAGAAGRPSASVEASAGLNKQSETLGIPPQFVPDGLQDVGRIAAGINFDPDLWGRNRALLAAATSEATAAQIDADQAVLMLTTAIASAYADLALAHRQKDVALAIMGIRERSAAVTDNRVRVGIEPRGNRDQAMARVFAARADVQATDEAIALTQNRIAALVGAGPDRGQSITRPTLKAAGQALPVTAGIDLIGRRPDIVAARLRVEAAAKRIDAARAAFYPNINLSALIGLQSLGLEQLVKNGSTIASIGPAISLPLFDGGARRGRYGVATADYDQAVAAYDARVIAALRDVADALASQRAVAQRLPPLTQALASAREAARIASLRYRGGLSNQLVVLVAEDFAITLERSVAELEARQVATDIALIRALGGGFGAALPDPASASPSSQSGAQ